MSDAEIGAVETSPAEVPVAPAGAVDAKLRGVKGWLLFFCISLTILNPLLSLYMITASLLQTIPVFDRHTGIMILSIVDTLVSMGIVAFSIYAGVSLWRRAPRAVQTARVYLIVYLAYGVLAPFSGLLLGLGPVVNAEILAAAWPAAGQAAVYPAIWTNYLMRSRRVDATYDDWTQPPVKQASDAAPVRWYYIPIAILLLVVFAWAMINFSG